MSMSDVYNHKLRLPFRFEKTPWVEHAPHRLYQSVCDEMLPWQRRFPVGCQGTQRLHYSPCVDLLRLNTAETQGVRGRCCRHQRCRSPDIPPL